MLGFGGPAELADLCIGTAWLESGFQFQRVWSNAAAALGGDPCAPTVPDPYYQIAPAKPWYTVAAGATVTIPLVGWSTAPTTDWYLDWGEIAATGGTWNENIDAARSYSFQGNVYPVVNNGETATLTVTAPVGAPSGSFDEIIVYSSAESPLPSQDQYHPWPVGVYIP
jgi:hypothetical protein